MAELEKTAVRAEDIHKNFGKVEVLKGISLEAREGDVISLIGSSGSGKSTFLRCINLLESPSKGKIFVGDELIRLKTNRKGQVFLEDRKQVDRIRTKLSMVFQHFNLCSHMTVLENIMEAPVHVLKKNKKTGKGTCHGAS